LFVVSYVRVARRTFPRALIADLYPIYLVSFSLLAFMVRIAVTGGIACGKSLVGSLLKGEGVAVAEADSIAHELMRKGGTLYSRVVSAFGAGILNPKGDIDRTELGARVFSDRSELDRLNRIVHPEVIASWNRWLDALEGHAAIAAVIVPLLFEAGAAAGWHAVITVAAGEAAQVARLVERGLTEEQVRERIRAQMPLERKMEYADYVIVNCGTKELLGEQTRRVLASIWRREHGS